MFSSKLFSSVNYKYIMSNQFKSYTPSNSNMNSFKNNKSDNGFTLVQRKNRNSRNNRFSRHEDNDKYSFNNSRRYNNQPKKPLEVHIDINNETLFPSLSSNDKPSSTTPSVSKTNFIDTVNTAPVINHDDNKDELPYGWITIDNNYFKNTKLKPKKIDHNDKPLSNHDILNIINTLNDNYELWYENFVDLWGEDEYENTYTFPNYDVGYFDRLDEAEELELMLQDEESRSDDEAMIAWRKIYVD